MNDLLLSVSKHTVEDEAYSRECYSKYSNNHTYDCNRFESSHNHFKWNPIIRYSNWLKQNIVINTTELKPLSLYTFTDHSKFSKCITQSVTKSRTKFSWCLSDKTNRQFPVSFHAAIVLTYKCCGDLLGHTVLLFSPSE